MSRPGGNKKLSATDPLGHQTTFGYDANGNLTSETDALHRMTTFGYDAANRQTSVTDPASDQTTTAYDAAGEPTSVTDPMGNTTTTTYTPTGQLSVVTDPIGNQTAYGYDAAGEKINATVTPAISGPLPPSGGGGDEEQQWYYNAVGEVTKFADGMNSQTTYAYDKNGNLTSITDPLNHQSTYGYDKANRQTAATDPLGDQTTYGYDQVGNQTSVTDPLGNQTTYGYDGANRQTAVTDPRSGLTTYGYDLANNPTSLTDPVNNQTTYSYNQANLLTKMTDPLSHSQTYAYDAANQLTSTTDRDGRTINYGYDQAGRQTAETWVSGSYTATFVYNKDGMVTKAEDPSSIYTYAYNADSQVTSVDNTGTPGVPTVTLSLAYDGYQNLTSVSDSLGGSLSYGYNNDNQLSSLALSVSSTMDAQVTFAYDSANRLTGMTRTGVSGSIPVVSTLSYDNADRLTNITDSKRLTTLANFTYAYNKGGELTSYQDNSSNSLSYSYDPDGELTGATGTLLSQSYTFTYDYDKNGNRTTTVTDIGGSLTTSAYSTGSGNELKNDGTYTYTYDNDGNMATQTNLTTGSVTYYSWDYANRLTEAKEETSSGTVIYDEKYTYDVNSNRIGVSNNGTQELYTVYLGSNPYIDFSGNGTLTERYLFNPQALNVFYGQVSVSGTTEWFLTDNINSIRQVVSITGSVLDAITYDPYGNILNQTSTTYEPRFLFAGGAYDSNTGNYQFDARPYSPGDGRFETQDPLSFLAGDTNLYRYVINQPTGMIDPSGLAGPGDNRPSKSYGGKFRERPIRPPTLSKEGDRPSTREWGMMLGLLSTFAPGPVGKGLSGAGTVLKIIGEAEEGIQPEPIGPGNLPNPPIPGVRVPGRGRFPNCFPLDTPVSIEGGLKPIQDVRASDLVWTYDLVAGQWKLRQVIETYEHDYVGDLVAITVAGEVIQATSGHPFWVVEGQSLEDRPRPEHVPDNPRNAQLPGRWVDAGDLRVGDVLLMQPGRQLPITQLTVYKICQKVYNFHVEELHCYAVGASQVLVHNNSAINTVVAPGGKPIGVAGSSATIREVAGSTLPDAQAMFKQLSQGGTVVTGSTYPGTLVRLPSGGTVGLRTVSTNSPGTIATIDVNVPGVTTVSKIKFNP